MKHILWTIIALLDTFGDRPISEKGIWQSCSFDFQSFSCIDKVAIFQGADIDSGTKNSLWFLGTISEKKVLRNLTAIQRNFKNVDWQLNINHLMHQSFKKNLREKKCLKNVRQNLLWRNSDSKKICFSRSTVDSIFCTWSTLLWSRHSCSFFQVFVPKERKKQSPTFSISFRRKCTQLFTKLST